MTDELTWLRELEQLVQRERSEFTPHTFEWQRLNNVHSAINTRIIALLEAETTDPTGPPYCPRTQGLIGCRLKTDHIGPCDFGGPDADALAMFCEHANEVPACCPCEADCYCKSHTCKQSKYPAGRSKVETGEWDRW